jgi:hypothetical protein
MTTQEYTVNDTVTPLDGYVLVLPTGAVVRDPETDTDPAVYRSRAEADAAAAELAADATDYGVPGLHVSVVRHRDHTAAAAADAPRTASSAAAAALATRYPAPEPPVTRQWVVLLPDGSLYRDPVDATEPGRAYTVYATAADADIAAAEVRDWGSERGLSIRPVVMVRTITTTFGSWTPDPEAEAIDG